MAKAPHLADNTPVLVGAGQVVEREAGDDSHMALAARAALNTIADTGVDGIAAHIDTILVTRLFSDMGHLWPCKWGRSDNPPQSIARVIGANPKDRIYSQSGGNEPQSRLIEFARDIARGERSVVLLASFSAVAADNPYAQFAGHQSAEDILAAPAMTHLYTGRMIAQDGVNQGAALLLCSLATARELGIEESRYVYIHGLAQCSELALSQRPDPSISPVANRVADRILEIAGLTIDDIDRIDIYSCFPCAVTAVANHLGLPVDGSRPLTLTGGLPYFGGPGNNYSMHGICEAVSQARQQPVSYTMVTCNGGAHAIILAKTDTGDHFIAATAEEDTATASSMLEQDPTGKRVVVSPVQDERLYFQLLTDD